MKSKRYSISDLQCIITDMTVMQDEELIDKAATTLIALLSEDFDPREQLEYWPEPEN